MTPKEMHNLAPRKSDAVIFSVITPSLNCCEHILENIKSVRSQGFDSGQVEHLIIDGGSTDGTIELLKNQSDVRWISERDRGLSDAVNKGIQMARGTWIIWLNADDVLADNALKTFLTHSANHPDARIFCGAQGILKYDCSLERISPAWDYNLKELLGCRTGINQAATFVHREVYERIGLLDVSNRFSMDYEWVVRAMHQYRCIPINETLTYYRRRKGSITDANLVRQFEDFLKIRRRYRQPYFSRAEFRIRFFIYTNWLREIPFFRKVVRRIKKLFGAEPLHPP